MFVAHAALVRRGDHWSLSMVEWPPEFEAWLAANRMTPRALSTSEASKALANLEPRFKQGRVEVGFESHPSVVELPFETALALFDSLATEFDRR